MRRLGKQSLSVEIEPIAAGETVRQMALQLFPEETGMIRDVHVA